MTNLDVITPKRERDPRQPGPRPGQEPLPGRRDLPQTTPQHNVPGGPGEPSLPEEGTQPPEFPTRLS